MRAFDLVRVLLFLGFTLGGESVGFAQQVVDSSYRPRTRAPTYPPGRGPTVAIDTNHHNPSMDSTLVPLRRLLEADGYAVDPAPTALDQISLAGVEILVIIDALADRNVGNWTLPTPSAFDDPTRQALVEWVRSGGALLLVADHMPFAGAAEALSADLGIETLNGFAIDTVSWDPIIFRRADGTLRSHPIVDGRNEKERIDSVYTYWGHAFRAIRAPAADLLVLASGIVSLQPTEAWRFGTGTGTVPVGGWTQGMALQVGRGRVVVLGDSGMLSAHLVGPRRLPVGLNAPEASQNEQFLLNVFHWLTGRLPGPD